MIEYASDLFCCQLLSHMTNEPVPPPSVELDRRREITEAHIKIRKLEAELYSANELLNTFRGEIDLLRTALAEIAENPSRTPYEQARRIAHDALAQV